MNRAADVEAWLAPRADEMAALLQELVAIDTENPPGRALGRCGRVLRHAMERLGMAPELIELAPRRELEEPCIVRGDVGDGPATIYFHGHFDVVPAQDRAQFRPQRREGRIVGRGTADMKGGLVSMLYGAVAARELGLLSGRRIVLHLVCDEETGSDAGAGHLREAGMIDPGALAMLTAEPTGGIVWHACRGAITLRVGVRGREAHVGQAHLGVNAFEHMLRVAEPLTALAHRLRERRTAFPMDGDEARGSMLVVGGATASGANFNVVPGAAWFSVDRRFNPEESLDEELDRLTGLIGSAAAEAGADVHVDVLQAAPCAATARSHPAAEALAGCVEQVEGAAPRFELCPGVLEIRWYAEPGIPAFAYGAGRLDVSHGPHEYIDEAAMRRCAAVYALFAGAAPGSRSSSASASSPIFAVMSDRPALLIVGGGRMGEALLAGLLTAGYEASDLAVAEVAAARRDELAAAHPGVRVVEAPIAAAAAVLAVKPGDVPDAARAVADAGVERVLSVAAGVTTAAIEKALGRALPVVRAMPNTPALVGAGAAAISAGAAAGEADLAWAQEILGSVGVVVRVPEKALDAVTGLSGSGPAYVFLVAEALAEAGVLQGLPRDVAETLAFQTILGSARLLLDGDAGPAALRAAVTSPGGTTAAGLRELERHGVRAAFLDAVSAATQRSRELGG